MIDILINMLQLCISWAKTKKILMTSRHFHFNHLTSDNLDTVDDRIKYPEEFSSNRAPVFFPIGFAREKEYLLNLLVFTYMVMHVKEEPFN